MYWPFLALIHIKIQAIGEMDAKKDRRGNHDTICVARRDRRGIPLF